MQLTEHSGALSAQLSLCIMHGYTTLHHAVCTCHDVNINIEAGCEQDGQIAW